MAMIRSRAALFYTLAAVGIFGAFSSYLASFERIVDEVFNRRAWFPYLFAATAVLMGAGTLAVGRNVQRIGLERLIKKSLVAFTGVCLAMFALSRSSGGVPSFMILLSLVLVGHGVLFPNLNSAAMVPVGHVAGTASAVFATVTTAGGALVGWQLDQAFDRTVNPFSLAFAIVAVVALALVLGLKRPVVRQVP
jgi:DHA1 family bicyclomycin/chloramphenicol resistance-like MFS transporter